jgi:Na+-transporting NADH:ubiquinone oxidoreductase subunit NqrB
MIAGSGAAAGRALSTLHFVHKSANATQFVFSFVISFSRLADSENCVLPRKCGAIAVIFPFPPVIFVSSHFTNFHPAIYFRFCPFLVIPQFVMAPNICGHTSSLLIR